MLKHAKKDLTIHHLPTSLDVTPPLLLKNKLNNPIKEYMLVCRHYRLSLEK
jgi:hypothetical protein